MIPLKDDNPTTIQPVLTVTLIAVNCLVFLYQMSLGSQGAQLFVYQYGAIPAVVLGSETLPARVAVISSPLSLFTSMFLHGGLLHIAGNMLYLWIFGNNIEEAMGRARYLIFYVVSGLGASLTHILSNPTSVIPTIGASGAISGVLGAYLLLYPRARVLTLVPLGFFTRLMYIPAGFVLGVWFLMQLLSTTLSGSQGGGGVAFSAHVGGFITGMLLVGVFKKREIRFFNPPHYRADRLNDW